MSAAFAMDEALRRLSEHGDQPPCAQDADRWFADTKDVRELAQASCGECAVLELCVDLARSLMPTHGVWGGVDWTLRSSAWRRAMSNGEAIA